MIIIWVVFLSNIRFGIKHTFWASKRNVAKRHFFYAPKTYSTLDSYMY